jgi:hypothetical protein
MEGLEPGPEAEAIAIPFVDWLTNLTAWHEVQK